MNHSLLAGTSARPTIKCCKFDTVAVLPTYEIQWHAFKRDRSLSELAMQNHLNLKWTRGWTFSAFIQATPSYSTTLICPRYSTHQNLIGFPRSAEPHWCFNWWVLETTPLDCFVPCPSFSVVNRHIITCSSVLEVMVANYKESNWQKN